jgi:hypothetical protein
VQGARCQVQGARCVSAVSISKQSFHQMLSRRKYKFEEQEQLIPLINEIRIDHPRMSARDIYLKPQREN